jgi:hypothetical protein
MGETGDTKETAGRRHWKRQKTWEVEKKVRRMRGQRGYKNREKEREVQAVGRKEDVERREGGEIRYQNREKRK